ncbi:MAG TPA: Long-chain-fatty-acid--CoA ligase [Hymenobacter sp.]|jgi:4-hydroxyphenylpyruvate dioxygenase
MESNHIRTHIIDYVEIFTPMAKALAYWHTHALGFSVTAYRNADTGAKGEASYVLESNQVRLVLTSSYPTNAGQPGTEAAAFIAKQYCGVKRIALRVPSVGEAFSNSIAGGAIPLKFPAISRDGDGWVEEAAIKLYDDSEITFINRDDYFGVFKPGYVAGKTTPSLVTFFSTIDHIAAEVRVNEARYWTDYLQATVGTSLVQSIGRSAENKTGMLLCVNQSADQNLTLVVAEPDVHSKESKVQRNIDIFGPGIHHLAFSTPDLMETAHELAVRQVEFVNFPPAYYQLLRENEDFREVDIDAMERLGIIVDKEEDTFLLQKFIKPISDRPFFIYEIVQRINGYDGFALRNINILKKAEEMEVMKTV